MSSGHWIEYSARELRFIETRKHLARQELWSQFVAKFGRRDIKLEDLKALCFRKGWRTGRTGRFEKGFVPHNKGKPYPAARAPACAANQFKTGNLPHNTKYLGHERVSKDGYIEISVDQINPHTGFDRHYVLKHRWLWEQTHGQVPEGMCLKCIDGNRLNTDPTNWELIPRAMLPRLNGRYGRDYDHAPAELKPAIMAVAKLEHRLKTG